MIQSDGDEFLKQFDGFINPGADNGTYSELDVMRSFTKANIPFTNNHEVLYNNIIEKATQFGKPYLGICAGAQIFSLYYDSILMHLGEDRPYYSPTIGRDIIVNDMAVSNHEIPFVKGSLFGVFFSQVARAKREFIF
jgi:gamma-glutamyl-gamma-aminobutyrate hydrolase PuuD